MAVHPSQGKGFLPEIRICVRTRAAAREIALPPLVQGAVLSAAIAALCGLAYLGAYRIAYDRAVADQKAAVMRIESANIDLQNDLAAAKDKLAAATRSLGEAQDRQSTLSSQSELIRGQLQTTEAKLDALGQAHRQLSQQKGEAQQLVTLSLAQGQVDRLQAERATLSARLSQVESERADQQSRVARYKSDLDRMRARLGELQQKLSARDSWQRVAAVRPAAATGAAAPVIAAVARQEVDRTGGLGRQGLDEVEHVLGSAGVDVDRLFASLDNGRADEGGPFVPPPKGGKPVGQLDARQFAALRRVAKALPLTLPMDDYRMTSPFGMRRDPFNGRPAFHPGIDLAAPYGTPIHATAPGIVTYAGWMDGYGKLIEINDGHGISTRYGHLHGYTVAVGERVATGTRIGYEGSTGRSTGPHVIYEVRVNGQPQDPMKFVGLARLIPAAPR